MDLDTACPSGTPEVGRRVADGDYPGWVTKENGTHQLAFGEMRACVTVSGNTTIIEVVVDAESADGPVVVFDRFSACALDVEVAKGHAAHMARVWLTANVADLDRALAAAVHRQRRVTP